MEFDGGVVAEGVEDAEEQAGRDESWKWEMGNGKLEMGKAGTKSGGVVVKNRSLGKLSPSAIGLRIKVRHSRESQRTTAGWRR